MTVLNDNVAREWVKPYSEFPLGLHKGSGQLCKKHAKRPYYFGKPDDWQEALARYEHDWPYILRGETPPPMAGVVGTPLGTTDRIANLFLARQLERYKRAEVGLEFYDDCRRAMVEFLDYFGRTRAILTIGPNEWAEYRHWLQAATQSKHKAEPRQPLGVDTLDRRINFLRMMSAWASHPDTALIARPLRFGDEFKRVPLSDKRAARRTKRRQHGKRSLREDVATILGHYNKLASDPKHGKYAKIGRAMFLLGLNGGYGNKDVSSLRRSVIDFDRRLIDYARVKTGVLRIVPLWKVTAAALKEAIELRPKAKRPEYEDHVFLTRTGEPWVRTNRKPRGDGTFNPIRRDAVAEEFGKVLRALELKRPGLNFYAVRHTFYGVAGGAKDSEARKIIVGHAATGMEEWYEQNEEEMIGRIRAVANHVYRRLGLKQVAGNPTLPSSSSPSVVVPALLAENTEGIDKERSA